MDGRNFLLPFAAFNDDNRTGKRRASTLIFTRYGVEIDNNRKYCAGVPGKIDEAVEMDLVKALEQNINVNELGLEKIIV